MILDLIVSLIVRTAHTQIHNTSPIYNFLPSDTQTERGEGDREK